MLHMSVTVALLVSAIFVYIKITPYDEIKLIRGGNMAAAVSLSGAVIGLALPLAFMSTAEQNGTAVAVQKGTTWRLWACPRSP